MGREDKKTQFSPYVPIWVKEIVIGIAQHLNLPMGDTAARIIMEASRHTLTISKLAPCFWRTLERGDHVWPGRDNRADIRDIIEFPYDRCERLKLRLNREECKELDDIMMALAVPDAHVVAALLIIGIHERNIIRAIAPCFVPHSRYSIERRAAKWHGYSVR